MLFYFPLLEHTLQELFPTSETKSNQFSILISSVAFTIIENNPPIPRASWRWVPEIGHITLYFDKNPDCVCRKRFYTFVKMNCIFFKQIIRLNLVRHQTIVESPFRCHHTFQNNASSRTVGTIGFLGCKTKLSPQAIRFTTPNILHCLQFSVNSWDVYAAFSKRSRFRLHGASASTFWPPKDLLWIWLDHQRLLILQRWYLEGFVCR
jgi:hypothetical protein